jgi:polyphosphate kinase
LLERYAFGVNCSNLDEFFMIRVASLKDLVNAGYDRRTRPA